MINKVGALS